MKKLILAILCLPAAAWAAPSGHQICQTADKTVQVSFGTYAIAGEGAYLTINGREYATPVNADEGSGDLFTRMIPMCDCDQTFYGEKVGSIEWTKVGDESEDPSAIVVTLSMDGLVLKKATLKCEIQDYTMGTEQGDD